MRGLLKLLVVLGAILAAAWIGGEMALARKAAALIADDPQLQAAAVRELREARRVGVRIEALAMAGPDGGLALPWLDLWVPPQRPNEVHATLPPAARLTLDGRPAALTMRAGGFSARFAPANGLALSGARAGARDVTLDGAPIAERVEVAARLVGYGADAPRAAGAAYAVTADVARLSLRPVTGGAVSGVASVSGDGRLWLDRAPARGGSVEAPRLVGLRADEVKVRLDDLTALVRGRVVAGAGGMAEGEVLIDTANVEGFLARAAGLGLLPQSAVPLAATVLTGLSDGSGDATASADQGDAAGVRALGDAPLPPPRMGELRITIAFRDGRTWLGPVAIGDAPAFPL